VGLLNGEPIFFRIEIFDQLGLYETQEGPDTLLPINDLTLWLQTVQIGLLFAKEDDRDWQPTNDGVYQIRLRARRPNRTPLKGWAQYQTPNLRP
jgi:hypothetical protein